MVTQPEALRLADALYTIGINKDLGRPPVDDIERQAAKELLRLYEENKILKQNVKCKAPTMIEPDCKVVSNGYVCVYRWLDDISDAARLAIDLKIAVRPGKHKGDGTTAESVFWDATPCTVFNEDVSSAWRSAVCRVASNIGENMRNSGIR